MNQNPLQTAAFLLLALVLTFLVAAMARRYTKRKNGPALAAEQLQDAKYLHLHHLAQAEEHGALAAMYEARVNRLKEPHAQHQ